MPEEALIVLKRDTFGTIRHDIRDARIVRTMSDATPFARPIARLLARREAAALRALAGRLECPALISANRDALIRSFVPGQPLYAAQFEPQAYFRDALRQLRRMHACRVAHNDLAKEANWICAPDNRAGIVDFQIATVHRRRSNVFRTLAWEDLRHLLKHKRHYAAHLLTERQRRVLARPLWPARVWRRCFKPVYNFVTRRILGWPERNSALERTY
jgi:RIO-like serine/threonine protein kinase